MIKNTSATFGSLTKFFHWIIALLVIIQFYLGLWAVWVLPQHSPKLELYIAKLHEPIGILIFCLGTVAILWMLINPHPLFPNAMILWERIVARVTHMLLYLALLIMPISGITMAMANGYPPNFFNLYQFPMLLAKNKDLANLAFSIHKYVGYVLLALIILHILAAFKHHFINRDNVLKRMLP
jgi:cytochrome b561